MFDQVTTGIKGEVIHVSSLQIHENRRGTLTTDGEAAVKKACQEVVAATTEKCHGNFVGLHVPCAAHNLQLPPKHQLLKARDPEKQREKYGGNAAVLELVKMCRATVQHFHMSVKGWKQLLEICAETKENDLKFIQDTETRWNSTLEQMTSVWSLA